ncbi:formyltransferase family protein [Corallococcus exiguus]|uniref:Formyl transferase n=1 Tax=Corallococcus exiguus TaxID=83462 RepID=A0A7X4YCR2_9BACT|nr:formyltransferase family protein [Corallococcus exiguus]NBC43043.1 formyl transferase [Corallococcus exiguus]TNV62071.1 formyl transferase [Corallococcus exiguus]
MIRFAYGCIPSIMSLAFANTLVRRGGLVPTSILLSSGGLRFQKKRYTPAQVLPVFLRQFGARFTGYNVLAGLGGTLLPFGAPRGGLMSFQQLSRAYGIPLTVSDDFSGEKTVESLRRQEVDLVVTSMCDQILREPLLGLPRHGCLNIHPSLLPDFRGVDSIFQTMLNGVPEVGTTLHRTTARIDAGDVYGQSAFTRAASDSHLALTVKATAAGVWLLKRHVEALAQGQTPPSHTMDVTRARFPYRSWPTREELERFHTAGQVFWRAEDFRRLLRFEDPTDPTTRDVLPFAGEPLRTAAR